MKKTTIRSSLTKLARFRAAFKKHFFLRFHMMLILTGVFSLGLILSKLLLEAGVRSMLVRYPIVLVLSYLMFFAFIRLWLLYIRQSSRSTLSAAGSCDAIIIPDGGGAPIGDVADLVKSGGGEFGGGGASGDFTGASSAADMPGSTGGTLSAVAVPKSGGSLNPFSLSRRIH